MFKIQIDAYESMINSIVDALQLRDYDYEIVDDHIESIDMHCVVHENESNAIFEIVFDNIESMYDAINDAIESLRIQRYISMKYKRDDYVFTSNDDDSFDANEIVFNKNDKTISYNIIETFTIETIDAFEKQNDL
jgi:hypothetical protein